jgi:hypothetical protein
MVLELLAATLPSQGQSTIWAGGSTNGGTVLSWVIVPAKSANNGVPLVTFVNATSDDATSKVQSYRVTAAATANYASTTVSAPVNRTNGFAVNDVVIIRHLASDTYEKRILAAAFTSATNLTLTVAPVTALAIGDLVYRVTTTGAAAIPCGVATLSLDGPGLLMGEKLGGNPTPLLLEIAGGTNATINAVAAQYVP